MHAREKDVGASEDETSSSSSPLLTLPDDAVLERILSFTLPCEESQRWEWIGILGQTCLGFRRIAKTLAPPRLVLADFKRYQSIASGGNYNVIDARVRILRSLRAFDWKRQHLKELHVNCESVYSDSTVRSWSHPRRLDKAILGVLRTLITTPASFPELEWLDVELQSDDHINCDLINAESLQRMPRALPSLKHLCLCNCFREDSREVSPAQLKEFFSHLQTPLTSLSLGDIVWFCDEHIETFLPVVGQQLTRLELLDCKVCDYGEEFGFELTDRSMATIAKFCTRLESFAITDSNITTFGLERLLVNNPGIVKLNLSRNEALGPTTVSVISRCLPKLKELRNYWSWDDSSWLSDESLAALLNEQDRHSGGAGISLELIGLQEAGTLTSHGLRYAVEKGVKAIEIDTGSLHNSLCGLELDVELFQPKYPKYADGSCYKRTGVYK